MDQTSPQFVDQQETQSPSLQSQENIDKSLTVSPQQIDIAHRDLKVTPQNFGSFSTKPPTFSSEEKPDINPRIQATPVTPETKYSYQSRPYYNYSESRPQYPPRYSQMSYMDSRDSPHQRQRSEETANFSQSQSKVYNQYNIFDEVQTSIRERDERWTQNPFIPFEDIEGRVRQNVKFNLKEGEFPTRIRLIRNKEPNYDKHMTEYQKELITINKIHEASLKSIQILSDVC